MSYWREFLSAFLKSKSRSEAFSRNLGEFRCLYSIVSLKMTNFWLRYGHSPKVSPGEQRNGKRGLERCFLASFLKISQNLSPKPGKWANWFDMGSYAFQKCIFYIIWSPDEEAKHELVVLLDKKLPKNCKSAPKHKIFSKYFQIFSRDT